MVNNINVQAPWTPIKVSETEDGIVVEVLGRKYDFGHEMFPQSIKADGKELLLSPIRLAAHDAGETAVWDDKESWFRRLPIAEF